MSTTFPIPTPITVAYGDGIGPEIMTSVLEILNVAGAQLIPEVIDIGEKVYLEGFSSGIKNEAWDTLRRNKVFLKAPITTPQGGGYKSLNVTMRKMLGLYANVRPCISYTPYVDALFPDVNMVIVRENEEDLYAGIEHQQTDEVIQCLKVISKPGTERIIRYAFEYARAYGRKKVTCLTKDNIMKLTDGWFHKSFNQVALEYPEIANDHMIIDIGSARIATRPNDFDVVVTLNLYGDIISDIAAEVTGSVGMGGSKNIGLDFAMFEAVHGSAPDIAGKNLANPSGLLQAAVEMLVYVGQSEVAEKVMNAWLCTLEDGVHTGDIYKSGLSSRKATNSEFTKAVIDRLGQKPKKLASVSYAGTIPTLNVKLGVTKIAKKDLVGVDIFLHWKGTNPNELGTMLTKFKENGLELVVITNRGVKVFPDGISETFITDHWRCRFQKKDNDHCTFEEVLTLQHQITNSGLDIIKTENLYTFDGALGYSLAQGQ
jgi:isocitrate dehydrogenase